MKQTSIFEKLSLVFQTVFSNRLFVIVFILSLVFLVSMLLLLNNKGKKSKLALLVLYIALCLFLIFLNPTIFDSVIDFIFSNLYFPNFILYIIVVVMVNISTIIAIINKDNEDEILSRKEKDFISYLHVINFGIVICLFIINLNIIFYENIDVFVKESIYSNEVLLNLIQISIVSFLIKYIIIGILWLYKALKGDLKKNKIKNFKFNNAKMKEKLVLIKKTVIEEHKNDELEIDIIEVEEDFVYKYAKQTMMKTDLSKEQLEILRDIVEKYNEDIQKKD